jgi:thiamine biosynthesis lipoprotein
MGSPLTIIFYAADSAQASDIAKQCFLLADTLNTVFSDYMPKSELNQLSATAGKDSFVHVSSLLYDILLRSQSAYRLSFHRFDITVGPLTRLWRTSRRAKKFPEADEVAKAKTRTGCNQLIIDTNLHRIKLLQPGMLLDLGGIAKGYVARKIIDFLRSRGIQSALVDAGGDLAASDAPPNSNGWHVGVNIPERTDKLLPRYLSIQNQAVATSGDTYQYMEHKGKRYSHIIDPKTGYGVTFQRNVTIIADDGADADWLASACSILSIKKAKKVAKRNGAALLITAMHKGKIKFYRTENFDSFWGR